MSPLRVVPDFITSFHPNPLGNGPILLLFLGQEPLDPESLVGRHGEREANARTSMVEREGSGRTYLVALMGWEGNTLDDDIGSGTERCET